MNFVTLQTFYKTIILNIELSYRLFRDDRVSIFPKGCLVAGSVIYFLFPIDFLIDIIPIIGQTDDVLIILLGFTAIFVKICPQNIVSIHKEDIINGNWKLAFLKPLIGNNVNIAKEIDTLPAIPEISNDSNTVIDCKPQTINNSIHSGNTDNVLPVSNANNKTFCIHCGTALKEHHKFCISCGKETN